MKNIFFLFPFLFLNCTSRTDDSVVEHNQPNIPLVAPVVESEREYSLSDTCYIVVPIRKHMDKSNLDCAYIEWLTDSGVVVKRIDNSDLGVELSYLGKENNADIFQVYDLPTGRQKILAMCSSMAKESDWFDDSALGDSVLLNTITDEGFKVYTLEGNKEYTVSWKEE